MARKRYTTEQIIGLLREAEVRLGQGQAIGTICRGIGISEQSYAFTRFEEREVSRGAQAEIVEDRDSPAPEDPRV